MRLELSSSNYLNTELSDEQGHRIYTVSTPRARKQVTTVTKHALDGVDQVVGAIEWHKTGATMIQIDGKIVAADKMLVIRHWPGCIRRHFVGPDGRSYKWSVKNNHYLLQSDISGVNLARCHRRKFASIMMRVRPSYLELAALAKHMMDYVVLTFLYMQSLPRQRQQKPTNPPPRRTTMMMQMKLMMLMWQMTLQICQWSSSGPC